MKKNIDELLNDYIDNQLSVDELEEIKSLLEKDRQLGSRLKALRVVHQSLQQIETSPAPVGFTERLMEKLHLAPAAYKQKKNYFFFGVVGFFGLMIVGILVAVVLSLDWNLGNLNLSNYVDQAKSGIAKRGSETLSLFKNKTVLMISSSMVLLLLILAYFGFESHKNLKKKINSFSH